MLNHVILKEVFFLFFYKLNFSAHLIFDSLGRFHVILKLELVNNFFTVYSSTLKLSRYANYDKRLSQSHLLTVMRTDHFCGGVFFIIKGV